MSLKHPLMIIYSVMKKIKVLSTLNCKYQFTLRILEIYYANFTIKYLYSLNAICTPLECLEKKYQSNIVYLKSVDFYKKKQFSAFITNFLIFCFL